MLSFIFTGGALFGILGTKTARWGRDPIVIMGYVIHLLAFFLIFINLPNSAPFGDTTDIAYISPSPYLAMVCSFLLGFGDACYNTQIYSILGGNYADNSTSAFALFKFTQVSSLHIMLLETIHFLSSLIWQVFKLNKLRVLFQVSRFLVSNFVRFLTIHRASTGWDDDDDRAFDMNVYEAEWGWHYGRQCSKLKLWTLASLALGGYISKTNSR